MKTKLILVILNCLALSVFASPETHRAKAAELFRLNSNNQDIAKQLDAKMADMVKKLISKGAPKEAALEIQEVTRKYIAKRIDPKQLEARIIDRLVAKFTEEETSKLIEIVKDPLLLRMKEEMGSLKKETLAEVDAVLKEDSAELKEELQTIAKKYRLK